MTPEVTDLKFAHVARAVSVDFRNFDPRTYKPEHFDYLFEDGIARITFNRGNYNEFTFEAYAELRDFFEALHVEHSEVDLVVLAGAKGNFSTGGDIQETMVPMLDMDEEQVRAFCEMTLDVVRGIKGSPVPVVSVLQGFAIGGGATIAAASHLRLAGEDVIISFPYQAIGLPDCDMGTFDLLADVVGEEVARKWLAVDLETNRTPRIRIDEASAAGFALQSGGDKSFEDFVSDEIQRIRNEENESLELLNLPLLSRMERGRDNTIVRQLTGILGEKCRSFVLKNSGSGS